MRSVIVGVGVITAAGCSDEMIMNTVDSSGGLRPLDIHAVINQEMATRADDNGFADGDRIGVFVVNYRDGVPGTLETSGNQADNVVFRLDHDMNRWNAVFPVYWKDTETPADVIGYYPYNSNPGDATDFAFEVAADQSERPEGEICAYEASDFLWSKSSAATPGDRVDLTFSHRMAGLMVVLEAGEGFADAEWEKLPKLVTVDNTVRHASIDLASGSVTPEGTPDRNIVAVSATEGSGGTFRAVAVPQTVAPGKSLIGITIDGRTYSYRRDEAMTYTGGKLHRFTLRVDKKSPSGDYSVTLTSEEIVPWIADDFSHDFEANSYFVVNCPAGGKLRDAIVDAGSDPSTIKNLKVTGIMDASDCFMIRDEMPVLSSLNLKDVRLPFVEMGWDHGIGAMTYAENAIPSGAFRGNQTIRRFILPDAVTRIGGEAFSNTRPTSTLIIPESVKVIDRLAFGYIWEEASLVLPGALERLEEYALGNTSINFEIKLPPTLKYIGDGAFAGASNAYGAFSIPQGLEYLGGNAFHCCGRDLTGDIVIPPGLVTSLCLDMGFANGTDITIPEGVKRIERCAGRFNSRVILPGSLERIEKQAFYCTRFSTPIDLPENIVYMGPGAFLESSLTGRIVIPPLVESIEESCFNQTQLSEVIIGDNVLRIENEAFGRNPELRLMEIGKNVDYLGSGVLDGSWNLQTIVCMAKEPPRADDSFRNLYFDKTVLEVPAGCVEKYRNAPGWRQFGNITEHRELAFNINEIACLDRGVTREGILRAEGPWRVASAPSWVHVSPTSGSAKEEITVTVDAQAAGSPQREGELVFSLDGRDYTTTVPVRQLAASEAEDVEIVLQTASAGARPIPLFIVGEGFTADEIVRGDYMRRVRETMDQFFDIEPYRSLRDRFTVTTAVACSPEKGTSDGVLQTVNKFGTTRVAPDVKQLRRYVERVSSHAGGNMANALVIVVANHPVFAGWSRIESDGCALACVGSPEGSYPYDRRGLVQHYAGGEAFAGLGDESVAHFEHIKSCKCPGCNGLQRFNEMKNRGYFANLTMSSKMSDAPWRDFIFHERYSASTDMWEGGYHHLRGVWRSEPQSVMGTYIAYFNAISRYTIYKETMRRAGLPYSLEDFIANDITDNNR